MTEAQFLAQVVHIAQLYGWKVYHSHDSRRDNVKAGIDPGYPDLAICRPPRFAMIELKIAGGQLSGDQVDWLLDLMASGVEVYVFWWSETIIEEIIPILKGE